MGCLFSLGDACIYCETGHPDAYIHVNIGIGMLISRENGHPGCVYLGMPIFTLASFPGPAQLSVAISTEKQERARYLFSRE